MTINKPRRPPNRSGWVNPSQLTFKDNFRGLLKRNTKPAKTNPNPPAYIGVLRLNDQEYWISGWIGRYRDGGQKYLALVLQQKERPGEPGAAPYEHLPKDFSVPPSIGDHPEGYDAPPF